jgi:hypothetical protein
MPAKAAASAKASAGQPFVLTLNAGAWENRSTKAAAKAMEVAMQAAPQKGDLILASLPSCEGPLSMSKFDADVHVFRGTAAVSLRSYARRAGKDDTYWGKTSAQTVAGTKLDVKDIFGHSAFVGISTCDPAGVVSGLSPRGTPDVIWRRSANSAPSNASCPCVMCE